MSKKTLGDLIGEMGTLAEGLTPAEIARYKVRARDVLEMARLRALERARTERRDGEKKSFSAEEARVNLIERKLQDVPFAFTATMRSWCRDEGIGESYQLVMAALRVLISRGDVVRKRIKDPEDGKFLGPGYVHTRINKQARRRPI